VTVSAGDVLLSIEPTVEGASTAVVPAVADRRDRRLYVQALARGDATVTISAPGFAPATVKVAVDPSGFIIDSADLSLMTNSGATEVPISAVRLDATTFEHGEVQPVRAGLTVEVPVTISDTTVGTLAEDVATFTGNVSSVSALFDPVSVGSAVISVGTPEGFDTPGGRQQITATVTAPPEPDESGGGGGGGGAFDWLVAALLALGLGARARRVCAPA
jgi:hypothetical protein